MSPFRRRLENSALLAGLVARLVGSYLWLCQRTIRWEVSGRDDLCADLQQGPVLLVMWHGRSLMGPVHWPRDAGQLSSLTAASPIGRASGAMQRWFGLRPMEMAENASNVAASRQILRALRGGISIGMTGDGPLGPAHIVKDAPLDWARVGQCPVWTYAFATSRGRSLNSWDAMWLPAPFGRGRVVFRRWDAAPGRHDDNDTLRPALAAALDQVTDEATAPF